MSLKQQWIDALRSGDYKQGQSRLKTRGIDDFEVIDEFCCLGVLSDISGDPLYDRTAGIWKIGRNGLPNESSIPYPHCDDLVPQLGDVLEELITMNDSQHLSFTEIADWIDKQL